MHHPTDRIVHTKIVITLVVEHWLEREIAQWVHAMKDQSDDPSHHERTLLPRKKRERLKTIMQHHLRANTPLLVDQFGKYLSLCFLGHNFNYFLY